MLLSWAPPTPAHAAEVEVGTAAEFYRAFYGASTTEHTVIKLRSDINLNGSGTQDGGRLYRRIGLKPGQNITVQAADPNSPVTVQNNVDVAFFGVPKGASLTFGEGFNFRGLNNERALNYYQVDVSGGSFTMLKGSKLFGTRRAQFGAIYVSNGGHFTLDGGDISDNTGHPQSSVTSGALVLDGGVADLNSGTIANNGIPIDQVAPFENQADIKVGGAITVRAGSTLNVHDGVDISNNKGNYGGAILAMSTVPEDSKTDAQGQDLQEAAVVNIEGGTLSHNTAQRDGGAVFAVGNVRINVSGGTVAENQTRFQGSWHGHGAGIAVWDGCFTGVAGGRSSESSCEAQFGAPELRQKFEAFTKAYPATFTMSGGTVQGNHAGYTGGGLYLATPNAMISGGAILNNTARSYGGGITVPTQPYVLRFTEPTAITGNEATGERATSMSYGGGGIWSDSYGAVTHGASLFGNTASDAKYGHDFAAYGYSPTNAWEGEKTLQNRVNGGGLASWIDKDGNPLEVSPKTAEVSVNESTFATANVENGARKFALANSRVRIEGNTSLRGGGIGTSGTVIFPSVPAQNLDVVKKWRVHGATPDKVLTQDEIPTKQLTFTLVRIDGEERTRLETFTVTPNSTTLDQTIQQWAHTLVGLPATDPNGQQISYKLVESVPAWEGDDEDNREFGISTEALNKRHVDVVNDVKLARPSFTVVDSQGAHIDGYGLKVLRIGSDGQENEVINGVLDSQKSTLVEDLPAGTYRVKATAVPDGFLPFGDFTFTIAPDRSISVEGDPSHVTRINEDFAITASMKTHEVRLTAYDADEPQRSVSGGEVSVTGASGEAVYVGALADGLVLNSLPAGEYHVAQTKSIDGYVNFEDFTFVIAADGTVSLKQVPEGARITAEGNDVRIGLVKVDDSTPVPSVEPTVDPSVEPTPVPSVEPTVDPSVEPTPAPSVGPTVNPTPAPGKPSPEEPRVPGEPGETPGKAGESSPLPLPRTGAEIAATAGVAALLVFGGVAVLAIRRKSRSDR